MKRIVVLTLIWGFFLTGGALYAEDEFPEKGGFINDFASVLSDKEKTDLENVLAELEKKTSAEVYVVTVETTQPLGIHKYAVNMFENWQIGKEDKDNGLLFLIALDDRQVRIAVGSGLAEAISDETALKIVNKIVIPACRQGTYAKGIIDGTLAIVNLIAKEAGISLSTIKNFSKVYMPRTKAPLVIISFLVLGVAAFFLAKIVLWWAILTPKTYRRKGGFWYAPGPEGISGGFSGGFGGFGGKII